MKEVGQTHPGRDGGDVGSLCPLVKVCDMLSSRISVRGVGLGQVHYQNLTSKVGNRIPSWEGEPDQHKHGGGPLETL